MDSLVNAYEEKMLSICVWEGNLSVAEAEDVLQDLWDVVYEKASTFKGGKAPSSWIWKILRNMVTDVHRQAWRTRRVQLGENSDEVLSALAGIDERMSTPKAESADECVQRKLQAVGKLYPEEAMALQLRHLEEWAFRSLPDYDTPGHSDEDGRIWFKALTGAGPVDEASSPSREGAALRRGLARQQQAVASDPRIAAAMAPAERQRRAERRRRMGSPSAEAANSTLHRGWVKPSLALAASVFVALIVLRPWSDLDESVYYREPVVIRGSLESEHRIDAPRKEAAEGLAKLLREAGLHPEIYQHKTTFIVDVSVLRGLDEPAQSKLHAAGIDPAPGFRRIEFDPR